MSPAAPGLQVIRPAPAARRKEVDRALATIADQVAQLPEPYVRALQPLLMQAQDELAAGLRRWLATAPDAEARFTAQHLRNALLQTRHALEHMERVVPIGVEGTLRAMGVASGQLATRHLQEEVAVFAGAFGHSVRPVQLKQAAIIAEGREQLIPRFRTSARRYGKDIATDIRHQMAIGLASGETFAQLTDRLQRHGGPRGLVSLAGVLGEPGSRSEYIAEGLFAKYRGWAARVVRTEANHAYGAHALIGLEQMDEDDPGYQKRWDATADKRSCEICRALDGVIRDLDKPFPGGVMHPPIHPNDRCAVTPWRPEWGGAPITAPTEPEVIAPPPVPPPPAEKVAKESRQPKQKPPAPVAPPPPNPAIEQERIAREAAEAERRRLAEIERQQREAAERAAAEAKRLADQLAKDAAKAAKEAERERVAAEKLRKEEEARAAAEAKRKADEAARLQREQEAAERKRKEAEARAAKEAAEAAERERVSRLRQEEAKRFAEKVAAEQARIAAEKARLEAERAAAAPTHAMRSPSQAATPEQVARLLEGCSAFDGSKLADARAALQEIMKAQGMSVMPDYAKFHADKLSIAEVSTNPKRINADAYNNPTLGCAYTPEVAAHASVFSSGYRADPAAYKKAMAEHAVAGHPVATSLDAFMTVVHEEYHSFGRTWNSDYKGGGILAEEVATEVNARRFMRDIFGAPAKHLREVGAYQGEISQTHEAVIKATGLDREKAWERLEEGVLRYKTRPHQGRDEVYQGPLEMLCDDLSGGDAAVAQKLRERLITKDERQRYEQKRREDAEDRDAWKAKL